MNIMDDIIEKNIRMIEYEKLMEESGKSVVEFGK
jgi:hypothetical protein